MITLPPAVLAVLETGRFSIRYMVRFDLDGGPQGVWNDTYSMVHSGVTYGPLAGNIAFDGIPGTSELSSENVRITIANLLGAITTVMANENWHQRPTVLFIAFMNENGTLLHAEPCFSGFLDDATITDAAEDLSALGLMIESNNRELSRSSGDTRSDASQRKRSATDGFYKHIANANVDSEIYWGRQGPQSPVRTSRG